ncbi:hypothetical protein Tco_0223568 [Tanacetum coccineum]
MGLGGCGIAKLATLWLGKVVEEGGMNIHGGGEDSWGKTGINTRECVGREKESGKSGLSWLRFLNFFNDPRIIREQSIAAYKGYRGGGVLLSDVRARNHMLESRRCLKVLDCEMGASFTQRTVSSISVGGSINLEGFLSSILLSVEFPSRIICSYELSEFAMASALCFQELRRLPS